MLMPSPNMAMVCIDYDQVYTSCVIQYVVTWILLTHSRLSLLPAYLVKTMVPSHIFSLGFYRNNKPKYLGYFYTFFFYCFKFKSDTSPEERAAFIIIPTYIANKTVI